MARNSNTKSAVSVSSNVSSTVRIPKAAELVSKELRNQIVRGVLKMGDSLTGEAELMARFGVSRPTLREAIRILESEGLVRISRGARGGASVLSPSINIAARHIDAAGQRVQYGYRSIGLGGIGVLFKTSPGVMGNRPMMPKQPCCFPDGFWLHSRSRCRLFWGHRAALCGVKLKGRTAADRPFTGIDDEFTRDGETTRCLPVSALPDVIGNGRSPRFVPSDKTIGLTFYGQDVGAEQRAVIVANQKRAVRPIPHELGIEPALVDHDPGDCQGNGGVSARSDSEPTIGFDGEPNATRIDDDQLCSSRLCICNLGGGGEKGGAGIVPPQQYTARPLVVRCADRGPGREDACIISVPCADFGRITVVRRSKSIDQPIDPRACIGNRCP